MRIDFSNEPKYWDAIVNKAADQKRRKRSLEDVGGNHRRWLEEAWREDLHFGELSTADLHKRWFGSDIIDWLKGILDGIRGGIDVSHSYSDQFIVKLAEERLDCPNFDARLDIRAETSVDLDVNYGFTLIATLGTEGHLVDLRKSYLYFRSRGDITSKFIFDAGVSPKFDTGDIELLRGDKFGAAFAVPGIVTIGPNFKLFGQLEGDATIGVKFTAAANFAKWDVRQTFPVENEEFYPVDANGADKSGTQLLHAPEFDLDLQLEGQVTAHIKPTLTFGIDFDEGFLPVKGCAVNLVADGHVTFHAELDDSNSFCYQVDAGADLYATVDAPLTFNWTLPNSTFPILPVDTVQIYPTDGKPACSTVGEELKRAKSKESATDVLESVHSGASRDGEGALDRRANVWGPLMHIEDLICPGTTGEIPACALCHSDESISKRQDGDTNEVCDLDPFAPPAECSVDDALEQTVIRRGANVTVSPDSTESAHSIEKRSDEKIIVWAYNGAKYDLPCGRYEGCAVARGLSGINKWYGFRDLSSSTVCSMDIEKMDSKQTDTSQYVTEHIYEVQLLKIFLEWLASDNIAPGYRKAQRAWVSEVLIGLPSSNGVTRGFQGNGWQEATLLGEMTFGLGSNANKPGLVLADKRMNGRKGTFFELKNVNDRNLPGGNEATRRHHRDTAGVFSYMRHPDIWAKFVTSSQFMERKCYEFDVAYTWGANNQYSPGEPRLPVRANGQPTAGLGDLYCYWIDMHLSNIEAKAKTWFLSARQSFDADFGSGTQGKKWLTNAMQDRGPIDRLYFVKSPRGHQSPAGGANVWRNSNYNGLWSTGYGAAGPF